MTSLAIRLQDLPGIASVAVDLDNPEDARIDIRLDPEADEIEVMERVRALLVAYGVRSSAGPPIKVGRSVSKSPADDLGVDVRITPIVGGARIEVLGRKIRSFRIVPANAAAIAQGVADAWCQVVGKIPVEIVRVSLSDTGDLSVVATNGTTESAGEANVADGWASAIARAVGGALDLVSSTGLAKEARLSSPGW